MNETNDQNDTLSFRSSSKEISIVSNLFSIVTLTSLSLDDTILSQPLPTLPFDIIVEILCRLPVKVLLQLRCVCKLWNSLICDPNFRKKHLSFSNTRHLHFLGYSYPLQNYFLTSYPLHSVFSSNRTMYFTQLRDFTPKVLNYNIVGSCNGILCLANYNESFVILWNPSIKKFKELPSFQKPQTLDYDGMTYGFGYVPTSDNYKVVVVLRYDICDNGGNVIDKTEAKIHILGTNFWKNINQEFPCGGIPSQDNGHFVSGAINWLASKHSGSEIVYFIVSFNLGNESYQEILQPNHKNTDYCSWRLGVLRDCLCMLYGDDVWVMKEYGNKDSWTKLFTIPRIQDPRTSYSFLKVVNIFEDDQVLLEYIDESIDEVHWTWKSIVYDFKNGIIKFTGFDSTPEVCVESMISPCF